jgi:hypothetical protein
MKNTKKLTDSEQINEHIKNLNPSITSTIEYIRQSILNTNPEIGERIKWNNPSFYFTGEMLPFDPKEYKREIVVMNLFKGRIMLVFPSGAKINDNTSLLTGDYKDGRRIVVFENLEDFKSKEIALQNAIKVWISLVE